MVFEISENQRLYADIINDTYSLSSWCIHVQTPYTSALAACVALQNSSWGGAWRDYPPFIGPQLSPSCAKHSSLWGGWTSILRRYNRITERPWVQIRAFCQKHTFISQKPDPLFENRNSVFQKPDPLFTNRIRVWTPTWRNCDRGPQKWHSYSPP